MFGQKHQKAMIWALDRMWHVLIETHGPFSSFVCSHRDTKNIFAKSAKLNGTWYQVQPFHDLVEVGAKCT